MENIFRKIVGHKKTIIVTFLIAVIICFISGNFVSVNYDMNDYLPEDTKSTVSINVMEEEFGRGVLNEYCNS